MISGSGLVGILDLSNTGAPLKNKYHKSSFKIPASLFIEVAHRKENIGLSFSNSPLVTFVNIFLVIESIRLSSLSS